MTAREVPPDPPRRRRGFLFDGHTDVPTRLEERPADLRLELPDGHVDLPRLRAGGVDGLVFALWVPPALAPDEGLDHARRLHRLASAALPPGELVEARSADQLEALQERGAIGVVWGLENGRPLCMDGALDEIASWGVELVTLCHNATHEWCDSATDTAAHGGLAAAGERIVRELNRRGMVVDVSHASDAAAAHALAVSRAPVVASHSSARALCPSPRNLPDDLVRAIAERGGLVMANAFPAFLDPLALRAHEARTALLGPVFAALREELPDPVARAAAEAELLATQPQPPVPRARLVEHVLHLVAVAGADHVGIGSDFDGIPECPEGFADCRAFPALRGDLLAAGLAEREVDAVCGENWLRVWRTIQAARVA
jgi:membrane dipeptidase